MSDARERKIPRVARTFKLPPGLIERYEARAAQLGMNRTAFVERALEAALGGSTSGANARLEQGHAATARRVRTEVEARAGGRFSPEDAAAVESVVAEIAAEAAVAPSAPLRPPIRPDALPNRADAFRNRGRS